MVKSGTITVMFKFTDSQVKLIEKNPVAVATVMPDGKPNVIAVGDVKVVSNNQLLIGDNYMNQTLADIRNNPNISLLVWNDTTGYKMIGTVKYFRQEKWHEMVKKIHEGWPAKGALLVTVEKIIQTPE